jgi:hypothetical protein
MSLVLCSHQNAAMTRIPCILLCLGLLLTACQKGSVNSDQPATQKPDPATGFINYTIKKGSQFCDQNSFKTIEAAEMKFTVRFDSSAIYQTIDPSNQDDINKLYGFSDNNSQHQLFSARIGWRWSNNGLRLFGYVYNNGVVDSKELSVVSIGEDINCNIAAGAGVYIFKVNNTIDSLPRASTTTLAKGYQLYPYFGGNETAPHDMVIRIHQQ